MVTDVEGKKIGKSQARKLKTEWEKQKLLHEERVYVEPQLTS